MANPPWYRRYSALKSEIDEMRSQLDARIKELGIQVRPMLEDLRRELIIRAVHESNWQEGLYLSDQATRALSEEAFAALPKIRGPTLDLESIINRHCASIMAKRRRQSLKIEELAAYNLATAHGLLSAIGFELAMRQGASLAQAMWNLANVLPGRPGVSEELRQHIDAGRKLVLDLLAEAEPLGTIFAQPDMSQGEALKQWLQLDSADLLYPMKTAYIHALHRVTMMGIVRASQSGVFRKISVHIENMADLVFPPASAVPALMDAYCHNFPSLLSNVSKYDQIMMAARVSYEFVRIHPYVDGNGRISRLLMNLVLSVHYQPIWLKADKKGRHRYKVALRRADRGNLEPLAALIALSLKENYAKLLAAMRARSVTSR